MNFMTRYKDWLLSDYFDEEIKEELKEIEDDEEEIEDRFYKDLDFGTGGLRGKIGAGTNRMNKYTVRKTTQGLANYIINYLDNGKEKGVAIAYDSRHKSPEFALEAALVLNGNGIKTYLFDDLRPTPELSFAVRELNAVAGIIITASHNPPEYNGYKVYGEDGGQMVPEKARKITAEIDEIDDYSLVKTMEIEEAEEKGLFKKIGEDIDQRYREEMKKIIPEKELCSKRGNDLSIIYTPLHGTANKPVRRVLKELGFDNLEVIEKQAEPDSDFSTVESPNPEEYAAFEMALAAAEKKDPDLILGTDPDGDRMGMIVKDKAGEYVSLNGNQTGTLLANYILERSEVPENGVIVKTIVTTEMIKEIAQDYEVEVEDVLTGFKYIGEKINQYKENGDKEFIFGFEESYGYLAGTYARDKDAVVACALAASMALYYKKNEISVYEKLNQLYDKYGYFRETLDSIRLEGKEGQEKINEVLSSFREERPEEIAGKKVVYFSDYLEGYSLDIEEDEKKEVDLPESNVLQFKLEDSSIVTIRPSGTEPKLKIYFAVQAENQEEAEENIEELKEQVLNKVEDMLSEI
ncbi:MAG: phospho-sugar mutase [Halanaerobiaceae bacterium]